MIEDHVLNRSIPIPLYYQIKNIISSEIERGSYQPGDMIPTEEEMIRHFSVSSTTVRQAVTEMVQEGRLYRRKGKRYLCRTKQAATGSDPQAAVSV